jgi:hypothetical protein
MADRVDLRALLLRLGAGIEGLAVECVGRERNARGRLGLAQDGLANGDFGIVFERTNDASKVRAPRCDMCQPQRDVVASPRVLAVPRSSPAGQGGAGTPAASAVSAAGSTAEAPIEATIDDATPIAGAS